MANVIFENTVYALSGGETVLDGLLRGGVAVANSCRAGACQSCLMRVTEGTAPAAAQQGLRDSLKSQGYFLACQCRPAADLAVTRADAILTRAAARVHEIEMISGDVARLRLKCAEPFEYRPGQFLHLVREDGLWRSYSLASLGEREDFLELHVRKIEGGAMSCWIHEELEPGESVEVRGPVGECFYVPGRPEQPLLLAGTGTGLAPLYAIARDALHHGHTGAIRLYHGALHPRGLYLRRELMELAAAHANFSYHACVMAAAEDHDPSMRVGHLEQVVLADLGKAADWRAYLCGDPALVNSLRKKIFLAGAKMKEIFADAFAMRASA